MEFLSLEKYLLISLGKYALICLNSIGEGYYSVETFEFLDLWNLQGTVSPEVASYQVIVVKNHSSGWDFEWILPGSFISGKNSPGYLLDKLSRKSVSAGITHREMWSKFPDEFQFSIFYRENFLSCDTFPEKLLGIRIFSMSQITE